MPHCEHAGRQGTEWTDPCLVHVHNATWTAITLITVLSSLICGEEGEDADGRILNPLLAGELPLALQLLRQLQIGEPGGQEEEDGAELSGNAMREFGP